MMNKDEAVQKLSKVARISVAYAEDLYDSFFEKPVVTKCVADWYEGHKDSLNESIWEYLVNWDDGSWNDFKKWMFPCDDNNSLTILVNMHQFGYEVEEETKYTVRVKATNQYLCNDAGVIHFSPGFRTDFTKNDLERLKLGWVFDCEGIEIEEVE